MDNWSTPTTIKSALNAKWNKGDILRHALLKDDFFPFTLKLIAPKSSEISGHLSPISDWRDLLRNNAKTDNSYGYTLIEKERNYRMSGGMSGKKILATHVTFDSLNDAVALLKKKDDLHLFTQNTTKLLSKWDSLHHWITSYPFKVLNMGQDCDKFLKILDWFSTHSERNFYLRQLDIQGVDTKFIESNSKLLQELLDLILPEDQIFKEEKSFEKRYALKGKPILVRFRILDSAFAFSGLTDLTVPIAEFAQLETEIEKIFIVENLINFLSFPSVPRSYVIFGQGYGVEILREALWLQNKKIYYWGDIDTNGFNILSQVRSFLPQTESFLMTKEILEQHHPLWVCEDKQKLFRIDRLTEEEFSLVCNLQSNLALQGVRLEQERIGFSQVDEFISSLH